MASRPGCWRSLDRPERRVCVPRQHGWRRSIYPSPLSAECLGRGHHGRGEGALLLEALFNQRLLGQTVPAIVNLETPDHVTQPFVASSSPTSKKTVAISMTSRPSFPRHRRHHNGTAKGAQAGDRSRCVFLHTAFSYRSAARRMTGGAPWRQAPAVSSAGLQLPAEGSDRLTHGHGLGAMAQHPGGDTFDQQHGFLELPV